MEASQRITGGQNVFGQRLTKFVQVSHNSLKVALFAKQRKLKPNQKHNMKVGLVTKPSVSISLIAKTNCKIKAKASQRIDGSQHVSSQKG